jgi:hypothetical protein
MHLYEQRRSSYVQYLVAANQLFRAIYDLPHQTGVNSDSRDLPNELKQAMVPIDTNYAQLALAASSETTRAAQVLSARLITACYEAALNELDRDAFESECQDFEAQLVAAMKPDLA